MTDEDEELLADLLLRWDELREQGQNVSSIELCQACPHLSDELERRIAAMKASDWLDKPIETPASDESKDAPPLEQRTLAGRYRLDDLIAEGGFAQVWRAYDLELHRNVAVKLPKPSRLDSTDAFLAEARRVARLKHPGIVPVHDVGRDSGNVFIVSEFVEGGNLGDHIKRSPLSVQQATRWTAEIADALQYAHNNAVIHRDIKPANILIDHHGRALLADFGIAQSATKSGRFAPSIGTLRYMAPEQLEGKEVDARSDVYSLGVVLYELLTGKLPYSSDQPIIVRQEIVAGVKLGSNDLSNELRRICEKALQRLPQDRFQSAKSFAAELRSLLQGAKGNGFTLALVALSLICATGVIAFWLPKQQTNSEKQSELTAELPAADIEKTVQKPSNYDEAITLGDKHFELHQHEDAIQYYTIAIGFDATNAQAFFKRGECRIRMEAYNESLKDFSKAAELDPTNAQYCERQANALFHLRRLDESIEAMEKAVKLNPPEVVQCKQALAIILSNRAADNSHAKRYAEAIADLNKALELDPDGINYHRQRASCYFNSQNLEKALPDFSEAIRREPQNGTYYMNRGYCLQAMGRNDEAAVDFAMGKELGQK